MALTRESQEGYDYQASVTGESTETYQARRLEEIGITHWHDMKRNEDRIFISKLATADPETKIKYKEAIAKVDAEVALAKPVEEVLER